MPCTVTSELRRRRRVSAATAFGRACAASSSSKSDWRCRFEGSTQSRSTTVRLATPARVIVSASAEPSAPQPTTSTRAERSRCWPWGPIAREALLPRVATHARAPASAARAASVIAWTGGSWPVQARSCPAAWATSISTPPIVSQPRAAAAARSGVSDGS